VCITHDASCEERESNDLYGKEIYREYQEKIGDSAFVWIATDARVALT